MGHMVREIKTLANRALEWIGVGFFSTPQTYDVTYDVMVRNRQSDVQRMTIVIPFPPTAPQQHVLSEPVLNPQMALGREEKFGNRYAWASIEAGETPIHLKETFRVMVDPVNVTNLGSWSVVDYARLDKKDRATHLEPDRFIQRNEKIDQLARSIVGTERDIVKILGKINSYVVDNLNYGKPIPGLYSAEDALTNDVVDCGGYDALFCSLVMAVGIPSRIVSGFWAGYPKNDMHAWVEILLPDGRWLPVDPSVEQLHDLGRSRRIGRLGFVGSDRIIVSYGCDFDLTLNDRVIRCDILQHPLIIAERGETSVDVSLNVLCKRQ